MRPITKAVIPVAGLGTRFLPVTKSLPKELLPVVDKPAIQFVVEEAVLAGLPHILMVTGRNKSALENHFDRAVELENLLGDKGDSAKLELVEEPTDLADIHYVRQGDPRGLGHAVSKAETFVGDEPFALLLGDDIIYEDDELLPRMMEIALEQSASVVALIEIPETEVTKYGIASVVGESSTGTIQVNGFIEKPRIQDAPSRFAVIGRYILQPGIFEVIRGLQPGKGGEIQLTDALSIMAANSSIAGPVVGIVFNGRRFDTGDKLSLLKASVEIASEREDFGAEFRNWLSSFTANISNEEIGK